jgi:aerobic-type carbon monoxide dehydrogenase small subunit (CoxS/CutS family)
VIEPPDEPLMEIALRVNGEPTRARVRIRDTLVDWLRHGLGLTGSHVGCGHGVCGACTVVLDGRCVRGCLLLAVQADGCTLETIEGAVASGRLDALQNAFFHRAALQCGFCTPGLLLTAAELLAETPRPDRDAIRQAVSGYQAIVDAIEEVAHELGVTN